MKNFFLIPTLLSLVFVFSCPSAGRYGNVLEEKKQLGETEPQSAWMSQNPDLWKDALSPKNSDADIKIPEQKLKKEKIGKRKRVSGIFDKWHLKESIIGSRPPVNADITRECKGLIDIKYALTKVQWDDSKIRKNYYKNVNSLIERIAVKLVDDFGNEIRGAELDNFKHALKTLVWQESSWNHYFRYKDWFFTVLSPYDINKLGDWGITQIAKSGFKAKTLLNRTFFDLKGYCSIYSSLYYGFLEFYFNYLDSRDKRCNADSLKSKILGAYNRYSSGFSSCFDRFSQNPDFGKFQIEAQKQFWENFENKPWQNHF